MNAPPGALETRQHESEGKPHPAMQSVSQDQIEGSAPDVQAGLNFHLSDAQNAQVAQAVFEQKQIGTAIVGVDGKIQYANEALADTLQYRQEELAGKTMEDLGFGGGRPANLRIGTETLQGKRRPSPVSNHLVRKSGETMACLIDSHAICDDNGEATLFLVFVGDARASEDAEKWKGSKKEPYRSQALQALGMLAGGVAHDFNNALEVIIGFASLARTRLSLSDPLHEPLKIIEESARGAADLARQLLDVSKDNADDEKPLDAGELINTVLAIIGRTFDRKIRIEHQTEPNLPCIRGIRNRLVQAILNLCINARDAMRQGGTLTLEAAHSVLDLKDPRLPVSNSPGQYVRIAVRDTGVGMTAEVIEHIFVPMFTTKGSGQGFGLGLAMVDRIVKESRGFISVSSTPGKGSEFALYLPAVLSEQPHMLHRRSSKLISGRGTILVVDDEPRVLEFLEKGLTRLGYQVMSAESGSRACEIYSRRCREIDCVLLDLIMPGMSGLETYARLRGMSSHVRIILSSGYSSGHVRRQAVDAGSPEFLEKPYTLEELSQALQKVK